MNTANRPDTGGTAGGFASCLAGEAAGWTVQGLARCCVGYSFHALTAHEVYETCGVAPYASSVIAAAAIRGLPEEFLGHYLQTVLIQNIATRKASGA